MINAQEIIEKRFEKSAFGYRADEVDAYLQQISEAFDKLQGEKLQLERKLEVLAEKIEEYRADEASMRDAILDARKLGSSIVKDAQMQADQIMAEANSQSARVIDSIHMKAEREKMNLSHLQKEVATFKNQLLALYKNHLELISSLPEKTASDETEEPKEAAVPEQEDQAEETVVPVEEEAETDEILAEEPVEEEPKEQPQPERESRFGQLRFGAAYDLKRDR